MMQAGFPFLKVVGYAVGRLPLPCAVVVRAGGSLSAAFTRGRHGGRPRASTLKTLPTPPEQSLW